MSSESIKKASSTARPWKKEKEALNTLFRNLLQDLKNGRQHVGENFYRDLVVGIDVRVVHFDNASITVKFDFNGVALKDRTDAFTHDDTSLVDGDKQNINLDDNKVK